MPPQWSNDRRRTSTVSDKEVEMTMRPAQQAENKLGNSQQPRSAATNTNNNKHLLLLCIHTTHS